LAAAITISAGVSLGRSELR